MEQDFLSIHDLSLYEFSQMLDLAALGYLYGRSTGDAETAAQTWSFDDDDAPFLRTLSNSNAASEIDASATTRANVIDLRAGQFAQDFLGVLAHALRTDLRPLPVPPARRGP